MEENKLIEGDIPKAIIGFLVPILVSSLIQQLYNIVDLVIIGQFVGAEATAAVGASALIITCLIGFFNGMAVGTNVVAAHIYGAKDIRGLSAVMQTVWTFGSIGGICLMAFGLVTAPFFLELMNTPNSILFMAINYLRIYFLSVPAIVLFNLCSGTLRAMGNSKNPMIFQTVGGILNIIGDILLVCVMHMGVKGAAYATVISQYTVTFLILVHLCRNNKTVRLRMQYRGIDARLLKKIMVIGIPSGVQAMIITFSNIVIQSKINTFGVSTIAAFTNYFKIEMLIYLPILALGQAIISFVGQNYGAEQHLRIREGIKFANIMGIGMTLIISTILILGNTYIMGIFTSDCNVIRIGCQIINITFPFYFLYSLFECMSCEIRGKGNANIPMFITIFSFCFVRITFLEILIKNWYDVKIIALVYPLSWSVAVIILFFLKKFLDKK